MLSEWAACGHAVQEAGDGGERVGDVGGFMQFIDS